jgi:hypothetical protein
MPKIHQQPIQILECVPHFPAPDMLVIALASFVIKSHNAHSIRDKGQSVLEIVPAPWHRLRQLPHNQFDEPVFIEKISFVEQ